MNEMAAQIGFEELRLSASETLAAVIAGSLPIDAAMAQRLSELFFVSVELFVPPKPG
ncbi:hypothetical protein [Pseudoduganella aquatica]|uniref:Uncharacterized protein n=1 Tax=Pseudoduganella aquatica TaxID=2660641 RepID=A0A7X4HBM4_9BURK|nr:hypothetical protein [Pseudoduganella aquatica]MYN08256.1 hypothetical protein [Pseudoduganella aquatica]